jgi:hypothetical protein
MLREEHTLGPGVEEMATSALHKTPTKPTAAMKQHLADVKSRTKLAVGASAPAAPCCLLDTLRNPGEEAEGACSRHPSCCDGERVFARQLIWTWTRRVQQDLP